MGIKIKGAYALLHESGGFHAAETDIYVEGSIITGVGAEPEGFSLDRCIDGKNRMVIPGLINSHTHAYMTLFRNYADDVCFDDWLMKNIMPLEDTLKPEDGYWGSLLGCLEMIRTGTTAFLDMHMFEGQSVRAADEAGMRAVISRGLSGEGDGEGGARRIKEAIDEMEAYRRTGGNRISFMLAPHAIYTCDQKYLENIVRLAGERDMGIHIHIQESKGELQGAMKNYGCSPVELLDKIGMFDGHTVAAHCVHLSETDMDILCGRHVSIATNPISNLKLGNGVAPVTELMKKGASLCIGTDGAASNNALNLFREMSVLCLIHKGIREDAKAVAAVDALRFATVNGARALGMEDRTGRIREGMKADLCILNIDKPEFYPRNNLVSALVYSANGSEVETVIIDGSIVMENNEMKTIDEERVYYETERIRRSFWE